MSRKSLPQMTSFISHVHHGETKGRQWPTGSCDPQPRGWPYASWATGTQLDTLQPYDVIQALFFSAILNKLLFPLRKIRSKGLSCVWGATSLSVDWTSVPDIFSIKNLSVVTYQVLTAASMKMAVCWDVVPCSHHPKDGGSKYLWNVGKLLPD
jgi:hypothetical protein